MSFTFDTSGARRAGKRFKSMAAKFDQAKALGVSDLARRLIPQTVRDMQSTHNLGASRIRSNLGVQRNGDSLLLTGYDRATGLLNYGARASRRQGVLVSVRKDEGPARLSRAFVAVGLSANKLVLERSGPKRRMTKGNYVGQLKQPLVAKYGPSVAQLLRNADRRARLAQFSKTTLSTAIRRQLGRL